MPKSVKALLNAFTILLTTSLQNGLLNYPSIVRIAATFGSFTNKAKCKFHPI